MKMDSRCWELYFILWKHFVGFRSSWAAFKLWYNVISYNYFSIVLLSSNNHINWYPTFRLCLRHVNLCLRHVNLCLHHVNLCLHHVILCQLFCLHVCQLVSPSCQLVSPSCQLGVNLCRLVLSLVSIVLCLSCQLVSFASVHVINSCVSNLSMFDSFICQFILLLSLVSFVILLSVPIVIFPIICDSFLPYFARILGFGFLFWIRSLDSLNNFIHSTFFRDSLLFFIFFHSSLCIISVHCGIQWANVSVE